MCDTDVCSATSFAVRYVAEAGSSTRAMTLTSLQPSRLCVCWKPIHQPNTTPRFPEQSCLNTEIIAHVELISQNSLKLAGHLVSWRGVRIFSLSNFFEELGVAFIDAF